MFVKLNCVWSGETEGVQDVVEMLYGGEVELNERNYRTVLKFSVVYDVQDMYKLCMDWVNGHLEEIDLYGLIDFGFIIESPIGQGNRDVLNLSIEIKDMRRLMKLSNLTNRKLGENSQSGLPQFSVPGVNRLLARGYRLFSFDKVVGLEKEFDLTHIQFADIVVEWITSNSPTQDMVTQLWGMFRQHEFCYVYSYHLRITICRSGTVTVPEVEQLGDDKYKYWVSRTPLCLGGDLSSIQFVSNCENCKKDFSVTVRLVEGTPCYEVEAGDAHVVEHVLPLLYGGFFPLSVLTNSYSDVVKQIKECLRKDYWFFLYFMYTCPQRRERKPFLFVRKLFGVD